MPCAWLPYGAEQVAILFRDASILHDEKLVLLASVSIITVRDGETFRVRGDQEKVAGKLRSSMAA